MSSSGSTSAGLRKCDFFISRAGESRQWALWVARELQLARYSVLYQERDFANGENILIEMGNAMDRSERTLVILSDGYFESHFTEIEYTGGLSEKKLLLFRVSNVTPRPELRPIKYSDLFNLDEEMARQTLLWEVRQAYGDPRHPYDGEIPAAEFPGSRTAIAPDSTVRADLPPAVDARPRTLAAVLDLCNRAALSLYNEHVGGETPSEPFPQSRDELAGGYWSLDEWSAQKHYVQLRRAENPEFILQKTCQLLGDAFASGAGAQIWLIGEAGTGKTTAMYRIYFEILQASERARRGSEATPYPAPMIFQPQRMDREIIEKLQSSGSEADFLTTIFDIWLARRRIEVAPRDRPRLHAEFVDGLRGGAVVLLVDSYDELARMDIQLEAFHGLLDLAKYCLCATRPEMYRDSADHQPLHIRPAWDLTTIDVYLQHVFEKAPPVGRALVSFITHNEHLSWLRNPRYLRLLSAPLISRVLSGNTATSDVIKAIEDGQYKLLTHLYNDTLGRLKQIRSRRSAPAATDAFSTRVRQRLGCVARSQLDTGTHIIRLEEMDELWELLATSASEIVVRRTDYASTNNHFSLVSYNWIDYFLVDFVRQDVLFAPPRTLPSLSHLWTQTLLTYSAEAMHGSGESDRAVKLIRKKLDQLRASRGAPAAVREDGVRENADPNLVQLMVRLAQAGGDGDPRDRAFERENFSRLNLDSVDLHRMVFRSCDFSFARLAKANLERAVFEECDFSGAILREAQANHATFLDCRFTLPETTPDRAGEASPVGGLSIQGAIVKERGENRFNWLISHGAIAQRSRYRSPFGKLFFDRQQEMLGPGLRTAEECYLAQIQLALASIQSQPKHLVDLMAGGGNKRLIELLSEDPNLCVLAIDRDGRDLNEIVSKVGEQFAMVEKEVEGTIDIGAMLSTHFETSYADLVIGKKALHELPREAQVKLIASVAAVLPSGGRFILFTDSPYEIDDAGYERLAALRQMLVANAEDLPSIRERFLGETFDAGSRSDLAVFSNLWVHLKDWANGNEHELRCRYFSGAPEIVAWASARGFRLIEPVHANVYHLVARRFNEAGFNQACHRLEESGNDMQDRDLGFYRETLEGSDRFRLFCEVVEHHLWDALQDRATPLGVALGARSAPVDLHQLHSALDVDRLDLSYDSEIGFDFPVHVLAFEVPVPR